MGDSKNTIFKTALTLLGNFFIYLKKIIDDWFKLFIQTGAGEGSQ